MSLDDFEEKNTSKITPLKGFADCKSFGLTPWGDIVRIADTSTWAGVFENGLSIEYQCVAEYLVKPVESVVHRSVPINIPQRKSYDSGVEYHDKKYYKENTKIPKTLQRTPEHPAKMKKLAKTLRSRKKKVDKPSKYISSDVCTKKDLYIYNSECECDQCADNLEWRTCDCCGKVDLPLRVYLHCYHDTSSKMCDDCARYEICPGCGMYSGGSLCRFCRHSSW